ncbi:MAG: hypothetical protein K2G55_07730, partial [Lachnospiraceae bacterium]|nr:hypothetical protein [Lachnospiraceae bacterium]
MLRNFFKKQPSNNTPDLTNADNALNYLLTDGFLRNGLETECQIEGTHIYLPKWKIKLTQK